MVKKAVIEAVENRTPAKCAWCSGVNQMVVSPGVFASCIVCGGKGSVFFELPVVPCTACLGSGKRNVTRKCFTCQGSGWERISDPK